MRQGVAFVVLMGCLIACGSTFNAPFSSSSLPAGVSVGGGSGKASAHAGSSDAVPLSGPRNVGTQVWLVPVPAGDMLKLATNPEFWPRARARVDVLSLYQLHAYHDPAFVCGKPCGPNVLQAFLDAVPGGYFRWINEQGIKLAIEAPAVKEWSCTEQLVRERSVAPSVIALDNISASGGRVSYISMDDPFVAGVADPGEFSGVGGCNLPRDRVAAMVKVYVDGVHERYPEVQIGLIDAYPYSTAGEVITDILELERAKVPVPFFHLDFDLQRAVRESANWKSDIQRIREFCAARRIPFGVIVWGSDGSSNGAYATGAMATLRMTYQAVGVTEHTITQSWAENPPGDINSPKQFPDTVPETQAGTHTWLVLQILQFMDIQVAQ